MTPIDAELQLCGSMGCHLCELAEQVVMPLVEAGCAIELLDIIDDDALFARYQTQIPVLLNRAGHELCWPFTTEQAQALWRANDVD